MQSARDRGARIASICSGAFLLAACGLLAGKRATTHWLYADRFRELYPEVTLDADVLYIDEGRILTSAGSAAGVDLLLHIVRQDFGAKAANEIARRLVMPAHRDGGQAQFIPRPVPIKRQDRLSPLLDRIRVNPADDWSISRMANEVAMSTRTFIRRFREITGMAPGDWVTAVRTETARFLLETEPAGLEDIAARDPCRRQVGVISMTPPRSGSHHSTAQSWRHPEINVSRIRRACSIVACQGTLKLSRSIVVSRPRWTPKASPILPWCQTGFPYEVLTQRRRVSKAAAMRDFLDRTIGQLK